MSRRRVQWSDLPKELLESIGKRLDTRTDVLRFRAVCSSWRSSIPPLPVNSPSFSIKLPRAIVPLPDEDYQNSKTYLTLTESTVYRLEQPQENSQSSISSKGLLVKVEESKSGKMRFLNLLSKEQIKHLPSTIPKVLNFLDYRFVELSKGYTLQYVNGDYRVDAPNKAIFSSNFACTALGDCDCAVLVLYHGGTLALWKLGAEEWTFLGEEDDNYYTDIILYKGQFHAVDNLGEVVVIDSSLKLTKISSRIYGGDGSRKHLVESCGDLYVVDRYLDVDKRAWYWDEEEECFDFNDEGCYHIADDFKVYKLNYEGRRHNWVEVKSLGDQVLFLDVNCSFFVSAQDFTGYRGNCIYFTDINIFYYGEEDGDDVIERLRAPGVFNLEDRSIGKLASFPGYS